MARSDLFCAGAFAVGIFAATTAPAAPFHAPYQAYINKVKCGTPDLVVCAIDFPVVPAGYRFEINNVSCFASGDMQIDYLQFVVYKPNGLIVAAPILVPHRLSPDKGTTYSSNDNAWTFATAGQHFSVLLKPFAGNVNSLACNISGQRVKL